MIPHTVVIADFLHNIRLLMQYIMSLTSRFLAKMKTNIQIDRVQVDSYKKHELITDAPTASFAIHFCDRI